MSESDVDEWTLRCDGGSRGNPGPGALGYALFDPGGAEVEAQGEFVGAVTNNVAEYRALLAGLAAAARRGVRALRVCMDSELVVRQMRGEYRVKNAALRDLWLAAGRVARQLDRVSYTHVRRHHNAEADRLVNEALDAAGGS
jgi:ribonuclease HI